MPSKQFKSTLRKALASLLGFRASCPYQDIRSRIIFLVPLLFDVGQASREQIKTMWDFVEIRCPYCGEFQQTDVDISAGSQDYWQDCQVCCCPILFELTVDGEQGFRVIVKRDDD